RSGGALSRGVRDLSPHGGDVPERVSEHLRIAVLGGVYANAEALAAVLADTRRRDAEAVFCLGDLGGFGAHPERVFPVLAPHRVLMCHGSPRRINEFLWESTTPDGLLRRLLVAHAADVLLCTHTGLKWRRAVDGGAAHAVNVGAVGRPENDGMPDVWYALLTAKPELEVEFVSVAYDHEAAARAVEAEGLPPEFAETLRTGWWTTCLENLPARERGRGRF